LFAIIFYCFRKNKQLKKLKQTYRFSQKFFRGIFTTEQVYAFRPCWMRALKELAFMKVDKKKPPVTIKYVKKLSLTQLESGINETKKNCQYTVFLISS
jgi:hypothetical protein